MNFAGNTLALQLEESIRQVKERKRMQHLNGIAGADVSPSAPGILPETHRHHISHPPLPQHLIEQLYAPLPPEAIAPHPSKPYLSSIKNIYMVHRLNQVFGIGGWTFHSEIIENDPSKRMVVIKVTLLVQQYGIALEQFGGNDNEDRGDAYKGAITDALSKIGSYLGIGIDVYMGGGPTKQNPRKADRDTYEPSPKPARPAPAATGSQAAANQVAQQKIAGAFTAPKPWSNRGEMKRIFGMLREKVGEVAYLGELARYNVTPELNWRSAEQAIECYHHLAHLASKEVA